MASKGTAIRDARFGIRRGRKDAKGQQSLASAATLTLGSFSHGALEDIGGMEVQQCFRLGFRQRKIDLTNAFKSFSLDDSFMLCSNIAGFLGVLGGRAHACARTCASEKLRATRFGSCCVPYHEALVRASGKDLAQGQVARLDPI